MRLPMLVRRSVIRELLYMIGPIAATKIMATAVICESFIP